MVHYWGQNSYGAGHLDEPHKWEKDLAYYCDQKDGADLFPISFVNVFNAGNGKLPEMNFANHCDTFFNEIGATNVRYCPKIGKDIEYCQSKKKTMLLSLGGAIGSVGFQNAKEAAEFAKTIWDMFLGGSHPFRPFGKAVLDGIDLDIEGGSPLYYDVFVEAIRGFYQTDKSKQYYVAAAPQCEFPDRSLQTVLDKAWFDMVFIQFYNNWCGVQNYYNKWAWNYPTWSKWAQEKSLNKNVKLFLGVPASKSAAGSGYTDLAHLKTVVSDLISNKTFGGMMMWDASQAENNVLEAGNYGYVFKNWLLQKGGCNGSIVPPTPPKLNCPRQGEECAKENQYGCNGSNYAVCNHGTPS